MEVDDYYGGIFCQSGNRCSDNCNLARKTLRGRGAKGIVVQRIAILRGSGPIAQEKQPGPTLLHRVRLYPSKAREFSITHSKDFFDDVPSLVIGLFSFEAVSILP
jgi:hypothetical protein